MGAAHDHYLRPILDPTTLDSFHVHRSILEALQEQLDRLGGTLLDIGSGNSPYRPILCAPPGRVKQYIALDLPNSGYARPNLFWDGETVPLADSSIDCAVATEVFEHCPNPGHVMHEIARVLRPGGYLFFTVPFLWPLHCVPNDESRLTPFALHRYLAQAGFSSAKLKALGGWHASLAQMLGLWVRRSPLGHRKRRLLSLALTPIVNALLKRDRLAILTFDESSMITGISGIATK